MMLSMHISLIFNYVMKVMLGSGVGKAKLLKQFLKVTTSHWFTISTSGLAVPISF